MAACQQRLKILAVDDAFHVLDPADYFSFMYDKGHFTSLNDPLQPKGGDTQIIGIAPTSGEQVGAWSKDAATGEHPYGFIHDHGKWTGLNESHGTEGTVPEGVTDTGIVDGYYTNGNGVSYGFVYVP